MHRKKYSTTKGPSIFRSKIKIWLCLLPVMLFMAFMFTTPKKTTIYLIGDSTMADKAISTYPETGWGMPFKYYFDTTVAVDNRAQNGRSTRTFIEQGRWSTVVQTLASGDYVLIQFGHNDEVPTKHSYTDPDKFMTNLKQFVTDTRNKGAQPILLTPVARRKFVQTSTGKDSLVDTHKVYGNLVRQLAKQMQVPLIDLQEESMEMLGKLGPKSSTYLYNHLAAGENPHYPKGKEDDTHFNELGARKMAEIVLNDIHNLDLPLAKHIGTPK